MRAPGRRVNWLKWGLGCGGLGMILATGLVMFGLIVGPVLFRRLPAETQERVVRRLPFLGVWQPTSEAIAVAFPTPVSTSSNVLALLASSTPTEAMLTVPTASDTAAASATETARETATDTATMTRTPTEAPSERPSETASSTHTVTATVTNTASNTADRIAAQPTEIGIQIMTLTPAVGVSATEPPTFTLTDVPTIEPTSTPTSQPTNLAALPTNTPRPTLAPSETPTPVPATATPTNTATDLPTLTPTDTWTPTLPPTTIPTDTPFPLPARFRLDGFIWEPQKFNNCGPANLLQALRYFGWPGRGVYSYPGTQVNDVAGILKPNTQDKNVSPWELVNFANTRTTIRAVMRYAGSIDLIKRLVYSDFGVILETGYYDPEEPEEGWIGHYQTIIGYDDNLGLFYSLDTLKNERTEPYAVTNELWGHFNWVYIVVYPPDREAELARLLGADWDEAYNKQRALDVARQFAADQPGNLFAWFNLGSSFVLNGQWEEAAQAYDQAFSKGEQVPHRMLWYQFGPYEAYARAGRYDQALALIEYTLTTSKQHVEEMWYWRGLIAAVRGDTASALADLGRALEFNPNFSPAASAVEQIRTGTFRF